MIYVRCCVTNMVLIRNNGEAVAFGDNDGGQCDVPAQPCRLARGTSRPH